jgi:acyl-CoA synthetase (AMP-forming)/AMP-acid ligase II
VSTIVEELRKLAREQPDALGYSYLADGEREAERLTYAELDAQATEAARALAGVGEVGDRVLLVFAPGLSFMVGFFACLYAGRVAVPVPLPRRRDVSAEPTGLERIAGDCGARLALSVTATARPLQESFASSPRGPPPFEWAQLSELRGAASAKLPQIAPGQLAYLQYTSGTTSQPRGVRVSHRQLLAAMDYVRTALHMTAKTRVVTWLPHYHDMGLASLLSALTGGFPCQVMAPAAFVARPQRWLEAITHFEGTISGAPNFAYELCARHAAGDAAKFRLQQWECAFCGAEPVRIETLERFARAFAPSGFKPEHFSPCYGLAEATVQVTGGPVGVMPRRRHFAIANGKSTEAISVGRVWQQTSVVIVDPHTQRLKPEGEVGEIWVRGPQVSDGYFGSPEASAQEFAGRIGSEASAPSHLRTGDLGAMVEGHLYVLGRIKDIVILNGVNHSVEPIEHVVASLPGVAVGGVCAVGLDLDGAERLVMFVEKERRKGERRARHKASGGVDDRRRAERREDPWPPASPRPDPDHLGLSDAVRDAVFAAHQLTVHRVVILPAGELPRSTSGKVRRRQARALYLEGRLTLLHEG